MAPRSGTKRGTSVISSSSTGKGKVSKKQGESSKSNSPVPNSTTSGPKKSSSSRRVHSALLCKECKQCLPDDGDKLSSLFDNVSSSSSSSSSDSENEESNPLHKNSEEEKIKIMAKACETILNCIGEDPTREGLLKTPERWAKSLLFLTKGYDQSISEVTNNAIFEEGLGGEQDMVVVRDIDIHSLCEHHMVPFTGKLHVGYIPRRKVLGLSKIARISEVYARRLQVQERLTREIAGAIMSAINPLGVAVVIECSHMCMVMRGVQKVGSNTVTSSVLGCFQKDSKTRAEFFSIVNQPRK